MRGTHVYLFKNYCARLPEEPQSSQGLTAHDPAGAVPQRQQPFRHPFHDLAVQDNDVESVQRRRQGRVRCGSGKHLEQALGRVGEEGFTDGQRQAGQLLVGSLNRHGQFAMIATALKALAAAAVMLEEGIADEGDQGSEREFALIGGATPAVEEVVEGLVSRGLPGEKQDCFTERQPLENFTIKRRWHRRSLG